MDQNATNLPHLKRVNKAAVNLWYLRTHLSGVIVQSFGSEGFLDFGQFPHDPNLTINVLLRLLIEKFQVLQDKLPGSLYIQLDNYSRENKNQCVLAFLN